MNLPAGASANLFLPPIQVKVGYGMLIDQGETSALSIAMKQAYGKAKTAGESGLPSSSRLNEGIVTWFFYRYYRHLAAHTIKVQDPFTGEIGIVFAVVAAIIHRADRLDDILKKYDYNLPLPVQEAQDDLEKFKKDFGIVDDIDWTQWK